MPESPASRDPDFKDVVRWTLYLIFFLAGGVLAAVLMIVRRDCEQPTYDFVKWAWRLLGDVHGQLLVVGTYILGIATYGLFKSTRALAQASFDSIKQQESLHHIEFGSRLELIAYVRPFPKGHIIADEDKLELDNNCWFLKLGGFKITNQGNGVAYDVRLYAYYLGSKAQELFGHFSPGRVMSPEDERLRMLFFRGPLPDTRRDLRDNLLLVLEWNTVYGREREAYAFREDALQRIPMPDNVFDFTRATNPLFKQQGPSA